MTLYDRTETGMDDFNHPVYTETAEIVDNVLVAPVSGTEVTDTVTLYGKRAVYQLGIPKDDGHDWEDRKVEFFGRTFRTFGPMTEGIEAMIPLEWNAKIYVEVIDG